MSGGSRPSRELLDDGVLRKTLEHVAATHFNEELVAFESSVFPHVGSYDCHSISVVLRDGSTRSIFLKDYGFSRQSKDRPEARRNRELLVYRRLLREAELGSPAFYGSVWDPRAGRFWLLIEQVEGEPVDQANTDYGLVASTWLAEMQVHFSRQPGMLKSSDFLIHLDEGFFLDKARRAQHDVARMCPPMTGHLESVIKCFEATIPMLIPSRPTLVHGGFIPWHMLIDRSREPERVCVYDWELAAVGSPLYDLAFFLDDAEPSVRERVCDHFLAESARRGLELPDRAALHETVLAFRLYRVIDWLSRSVEKAYPTSKLKWLVDRAQKHRSELCL